MEIDNVALALRLAKQKAELSTARLLALALAPELANKPLVMTFKSQSVIETRPVTVHSRVNLTF